ncbi:MAG: ankyrin repeat domain-containing protein [Candidatus Amoebophilus sp.]
MIYKPNQQLAACILLISLCLQSCGTTAHSPLAIQQNSMQAAIEQLADKQLVSKEGHLVKFFCGETGHLQARIKEKLPIGFSKARTLPVSIQADIPFDTVFRNEIVHVSLPYKGKEGYVYLGSTAVKGGSNSGSSKGKEKLKDEENQIEELEEKGDIKQGSTSYIKSREDGIQPELVDCNYLDSKKFQLQPENYKLMTKYLQKLAMKGDERAINLIQEFNEANLIGGSHLLEECAEKEQGNESSLIGRASGVWNRIIHYISYHTEKPAIHTNPFHSKFKTDKKLFRAITENNITRASELIALGTTIYIRNKYGDTPLNIALSKGHLEIARLLLDKGADVNEEDKDGNTPLHVASINGQTQLVKLLIEKGANVNAKCVDNMSPLHIAISSFQEEIVKLLLKAGADVNATCNDGWTALHSAACDGHLKLMTLLLEHGADINAINNEGVTPRQIFAKNNCIDLFDLIDKKQNQT